MQQPPYGQPPGQPPNMPPGYQPPPMPPQQQWPPQQPYYPPQQPYYPPQQGHPPPGYPYGPQPPQKKKGLPAIAIIGIVLGSIFVAIILLGILASAASGGSKSATAAPRSNVAAATNRPSPTPLPALNDAVRTSNWEITATKVEQPGATLPGTFSAKATGTYLVVAVTAKNLAKTPYPVNVHDFTLRDSNGVTFKIDDSFEVFSYARDRGGQDVGKDVPPGTTATYYLVFDVAPDAHGFKLVFEQEKKPQIELGV